MLVEYQQRGKVNQFVDKRFGENNAQLTLEEKMVTRFAEERKLKVTSGTNHFSLDDDEDGGELTHFGQSLSTMDEFDNIGLDIDEEEEGLIVPPLQPLQPPHSLATTTDSFPLLLPPSLLLFSSLSSLRSLLFALFSSCFFLLFLVAAQIAANIVRKAHFGGGEGEGEGEGEDDYDPDRPKSKKEVMNEIIAKSKQGKLERQKAKQEDEELLDKLDHDFSDVKALLMGISGAQPREASKKPVLELFKKDGNDDGYDKIVRELASDKRSHPTDRMKSSMELAREEKNRLETLEDDRLRRMAGVTEMEEDMDDAVHRMDPRVVSGDDLEGNYVLDRRNANDAIAYHGGRLLGAKRDRFG